MITLHRNMVIVSLFMAGIPVCAADSPQLKPRITMAPVPQLLDVTGTPIDMSLSIACVTSASRKISIQTVSNSSTSSILSPSSSVQPSPSSSPLLSPMSSPASTTGSSPVQTHDRKQLVPLPPLTSLGSAGCLIYDLAGQHSILLQRYPSGTGSDCP